LPEDLSLPVGLGLEDLLHAKGEEQLDRDVTITESWACNSVDSLQ
jgi:hypothetical protein